MRRPASFDYEAKIWGAPEIKSSPFYIQGLKLKYALDDLKNVEGKVLDVGCGAGNIPKAIKKYRSDLEVWGVDISKNAIEMASKNTKGVRFKIASAERLPFVDRYFDAVLMFDVLEHLPKPEIALKEARRVLKENGILHIFSPLDRQPWTLYWLFYKLGWRAKDKHTGHLHSFSSNEFESLLKKSGFKIKKKRFSFHFLFSLCDIAYFSLLELFKLRVSSSVEGIIDQRKNDPIFFVFNLFYRLIVALGYFESRLFSKFPGGGLHLTLERT